MTTEYRATEGRSPRPASSSPRDSVHGTLHNENVKKIAELERAALQNGRPLIA
jgi:hypothetical protein